MCVCVCVPQFTCVCVYLEMFDSTGLSAIISEV